MPRLKKAEELRLPHPEVSTARPTRPRGTTRSEVLQLLRARSATSSPVTARPTPRSTPKPTPLPTVRSTLRSSAHLTTRTRALPTVQPTRHLRARAQLFELFDLQGSLPTPPTPSPTPIFTPSPVPSSTRHPTPSPTQLSQATTSRTEVLKLLRKLLNSVQPSQLDRLVDITTTTARTTTTTTTTIQPITTTTKITTQRHHRWKSPPSLRFEDFPTRLPIDLTPPPISGLSPATTVHPDSPFPRLQPPRHDILSSHIFLPDPLAAVTPASTLHPASPFPSLEPPPPSGHKQPQRSQPRSGRARDLARPRSRASQERPVLRTRLVAPRARQPATNRRLMLEAAGPGSESPLEQLARATVPTLRPAAHSYFGTPASRYRDQTALQRLAAGPARVAVAFGEMEPVRRTRYQRGQEEAASPDLSSLAGVRTGTTAVGLVERDSRDQPVFRVPVFTTPIPHNGQFLGRQPGTGRPGPRADPRPGPGRPAGRTVPLSSAVGRKLETFPRFTKLSNYRSAAARPMFSTGLSLLLVAVTCYCNICHVKI